MDGIQNLGVYSLGAVGISLLPGPNSLYGLSGAGRNRGGRHLSPAPATARRALGLSPLFLYFSLQLFGATL